MNPVRQSVSNLWNHFQHNLFPWLEEELGPLSKKQQKLIQVFELTNLDSHIPYSGRGKGRPSLSRAAIIRAFIAKAVYDFPTTEVLLDHLRGSKTLRRLCGWEKASDIPSASTFSRAFAEFSSAELAQSIHAKIIEDYLSDQLAGHISRDSTAISAREKPVKKEQPEQKKKPRGRPKKGEERIKEPTRIERQIDGMTLEEMKADLPVDCDVGTKMNSKGYKTSWIGYKLHIDAMDGGIPISCLLTSASVHDSQVAIPLAELTAKRVTSCYDLMDSAYDSPLIKQHSRSLGHVLISDKNPRNKEAKKAIECEQLARRKAGHNYPELIRYNERSTVERVNGRLKDEFGGRHLRVKGCAKVMTHLMLGVVVLTSDQLMRIIA